MRILDLLRDGKVKLSLNGQGKDVLLLLLAEAKSWPIIDISDCDQYLIQLQKNDPDAYRKMGFAVDMAPSPFCECVLACRSHDAAQSIEFAVLLVQTRDRIHNDGSFELTAVTFFAFLSEPDEPMAVQGITWQCRFAASGQLIGRPMSSVPLNNRSAVEPFYSAAFALTLLNCKNVHAREQPCPPKLAKRYQERHGYKRPRYYVLDIEPMRQKFRDANGGKDGISLAKALHICRGHFKNYDERPLFGKLKGTYWWQPHVRGTAEAGVIDKDYRIKLSPEPKQVDP